MGQGEVYLIGEEENKMEKLLTVFFAIFFYGLVLVVLVGLGAEVRGWWNAPVPTAEETQAAAEAEIADFNREHLADLQAECRELIPRAQEGQVEDCAKAKLADEDANAEENSYSYPDRRD